jgi:hypothetical protein
VRDLMLADLDRAMEIVRAGAEVIPSWRVIYDKDEHQPILTRFDPDAPGQRDRMIHLIQRFMAWKHATAFIFATEAWVGPAGTRTGEEEAVFAVGVVQGQPPQGVMRYIARRPRITFGAPMWLDASYLDPLYGQMLPSAETRPLDDAEVDELRSLFTDLSSPLE